LVLNRFTCSSIITVLGLVKARQIGYSEADLLTSHPLLSATNLANAWVYAAALPERLWLGGRGANAGMNGTSSQTASYNPQTRSHQRNTPGST
jgi:hypothetical protein